MKFRHVTHRMNVPSIKREGLLQAMARGKYPVVWLAIPDDEEWAIEHVSGRHGWDPDELVVLEVDTPPDYMRKHSSGKWMSFRDIPPEAIKTVHSVARNKQASKRNYRSVR